MFLFISVGIVRNPFHCLHVARPSYPMGSLGVAILSGQCHECWLIALPSSPLSDMRPPVLKEIIVDAFPHYKRGSPSSALLGETTARHSTCFPCLALLPATRPFVHGLAAFLKFHQQVVTTPWQLHCACKYSGALLIWAHWFPTKTVHKVSHLW